MNSAVAIENYSHSRILFFGKSKRQQKRQQRLAEIMSQCVKDSASRL